MVKEWSEFKEEVKKTSSYNQSLKSHMLQQSANGISFAIEATVGSLLNNKSTRELTQETLEEIAQSDTYKEVSEKISKIDHEVDAYLDTHPKTKEQLQNVQEIGEKTIDVGEQYATKVAKKFPEEVRNVKAGVTIASSIIPVAKGAKVAKKSAEALGKGILSVEKVIKRGQYVEHVIKPDTHYVVTKAPSKIHIRQDGIQALEKGEKVSYAEHKLDSQDLPSYLDATKKKEVILHYAGSVHGNKGEGNKYLIPLKKSPPNGIKVTDTKAQQEIYEKYGQQGLENAKFIHEYDGAISYQKIDPKYIDLENIIKIDDEGYTVRF